MHRALEEYLKRTDNGRRRPQTDRDKREIGRELRESKACPDEQTLVQIGRHITTTEENAEDAEHQLRQYLVLELLSKHIGEAYRGVVTGVSARGVFVQLDKFLADGLIKVSDLPGDVTRGNKPPFYRVDQRTGALVDQNSGRSFNMGDTVTVRIAQVDLAISLYKIGFNDGSQRTALLARALAVCRKLEADGRLSAPGGQVLKAISNALGRLTKG